MIINKNEYYNFYNKYKNLSIYNVFYKLLGLGKSFNLKKLWYKNLGLNINKNYKLRFLSSLQHNINIFVLTIYYQKKLSFFNIKLRNYYKYLKHIPGTFRFIQASHGLPVNGQRTRSNARTTRRLRYPSKKK
jgi:ribosomal protein S13